VIKKRQISPLINADYTDQKNFGFLAAFSAFISGKVLGFSDYGDYVRSRRFEVKFGKEQLYDVLLENSVLK